MKAEKLITLELLSCTKLSSKDGDTYEVEVKYLGGDEYFPDGKGGQLGDRGFIGNSPVIQVKKTTLIIRDYLEPGKYDYTIDRDRQVDIAVQHTGEHLLSGVAFRDYGFKNVGFRMGEAYTTVDLDTCNISDEVILELEKKVNDAIKSGIEIKDFTLGRDESEKRAELRKEISAKIEGEVRFIEIEGIDVCACAGFHVKNTRDVQLFKFIKWERVKGDKTRLYFLCGERALDDYRQKDNIIREANRLFSSQNEEILTFIENILMERKNLSNSVKKLATDYAKLLAKELMDEARLINGKKIILFPENSEVAGGVPRFLEGEYTYIYGDGGKYIITSKEINCKAFIEEMRAKHSLKGGGSESRGSFQGDIKEAQIISGLEDFLQSI